MGHYYNVKESESVRLMQILQWFHKILKTYRLQLRVLEDTWNLKCAGSHIGKAKFI